MTQSYSLFIPFCSGGLLHSWSDLCILLNCIAFGFHGFKKKQNLLCISLNAITGVFFEGVRVGAGVFFV